jgi:hypothetical protein
MSEIKSYNVSRLLTRYYSSASSQASSTYARQGSSRWWDNTDKTVGLIGFSGLESIDWSSKTILSITLKLQHGEGGSYGSKTFFFWPSNLQGSDSISGKKGSEFIQNLTILGSITTQETPANTLITFNLSSNSHQELFKNFVNYLKTGGKNTICLYADEIVASSKNYSDNYLAVLGGSITINYEELIVYYGINKKWQPCLVYYGVNGQWQQVIPYYGKNGKWKQLGGG